jgi:hypothetical protein
MAGIFDKVVVGSIDHFVNWVIIPVTGIIPKLVESGLLWLAFAALWLGFFIALVVDPSALEGAWSAITSMPLPVQLVAWLLFLPLIAGLWVMETDWPLVIQAGLVIAIAAVNLVLFIPRREPGSTVATAS